MLRQYPWPNNYTQFKNLLRSLATLTNGPYIRSSSVADLLSKERSLRSAPAAHPAAVISTDTSRTLESIIGEVVQQTVAAHGGNRAAAARQLGISRTTLWRYLGKMKPGSLPTPPDAFDPQRVRFRCFIRSTERAFFKNVQPASIGCSSRAWVFPNKYFATQKWYIYTCEDTSC